MWYGCAVLGAASRVEKAQCLIFDNFVLIEKCHYVEINECILWNQLVIQYEQQQTISHISTNFLIQLLFSICPFSVKRPLKYMKTKLSHE